MNKTNISQKYFIIEKGVLYFDVKCSSNGIKQNI